MEIKIERATMKDLPGILRIERLGFSPAEAGTEEAFRERIEKLASTFLVAKIDRQLAEFVVAVASAEEFVQDEMYEQTPTNLRRGGNLLVLSIATDPQYRGHGIGSQLLARLEADARKANRGTIALDSLEHNIPFYEHNGFQRVQTSQSQHAGETWYSLVKAL